MAHIKWLIVALSISTAFAHDSSNKVKIFTQGNYRYVISNGYPSNHGEFPNSGNPNTIKAQHYRFRIPLKPTLQDNPTEVGHMDFGVALDGIPFDPNSADYWHNDRNWNYEAMSSQVNLGLDHNHAHVQPNGAYHYHGLPDHLYEDVSPDKLAKQEMVLLGFAADGFPIYGLYGYENTNDSKSGLKALQSAYQLKSGNRQSIDGPGGSYDGAFIEDYHYVEGSGDLDRCNGRQGVTPEYPNGTYYYVITNTFPFIPRCFKGIPDSSFGKKGPRPGMQRRPPRSGMQGPPPFGMQGPPQPTMQGPPQSGMPDTQPSDMQGLATQTKGAQTYVIDMKTPSSLLHPFYPGHLQPYTPGNAYWWHPSPTPFRNYSNNSPYHHPASGKHEPRNATHVQVGEPHSSPVYHQHHHPH